MIYEEDRIEADILGDLGSAYIEKAVCDVISPGEVKEKGKVRSKLLTWIAVFYIKI